MWVDSASSIEDKTKFIIVHLFIYIYIYVYFFASFLKHAIDFINDFIHIEGIFRRNGTASRLKELKVNQLTIFKNILVYLNSFFFN